MSPPPSTFRGTLKGQAALVVGGSGGIGGQVARRLAGEGARVVVHFRSNEERANDVVAAIQEAGGEAVTHPGDAGTRTDADGLVARCIETFGRLDVLVNAAGCTREVPLMMMSDEDWKSVQEANIDPVFQTCRAALRPMIDQRNGVIINISSVASRAATAGMVSYAAAKGAVDSLTRTLAREVARFGIRVNAVAPGVIETEMTANLTDEIRAKLTSRIALGRFGTSKEVADTVTFLAGPNAAYITGQVFPVDGGLG